MTTTDALTLTIPNERRFFGVVRLLVGGLAARLDLPYEQMDDLQLAVESVLMRDSAPGDVVTVELELRGPVVELRIGPLVTEKLRADLADAAGEVDLRRLLSTLVDSIEVVDRDGREWLRLEKRVPVTSAGP